MMNGHRVVTAGTDASAAPAVPDGASGSYGSFASAAVSVDDAVGRAGAVHGCDDLALPARLADAGVDRRAFLKFCAGVTATLALPPRFAHRIAAALAKVQSPVVVWLEFQDCAGDSEAFVRSQNPSAVDLLLGLI